jgi:thiol-disulfide isomerase/thioredoxin
MKFLHIDPKTDNINLFDEYVSQGKHIFVLIYLEGCGPCIATRPEWKKLENTLNDKYKTNDDLVVIDVDQSLLEKMTKLKEEPKGFPTILYITDKGETSEEYNEEDEKLFRKVDSFVKWIDSKMKKQKGGKRRTIKKRKTRISKRSKKNMKTNRNKRRKNKTRRNRK